MGGWAVRDHLSLHGQPLIPSPLAAGEPASQPASDPGGWFHGRQRANGRVRRAPPADPEKSFGVTQASTQKAMRGASTGTSAGGVPSG